MKVGFGRRSRSPQSLGGSPCKIPLGNLLVVYPVEIRFASRARCDPDQLDNEVTKLKCFSRSPLTRDYRATLLYTPHLRAVFR